MSDTDRAADTTGQYATGVYLNARISLHQRFRVGSVPWHEWLFERMAIPAGARILELGCGTGLFWQAIRDRISADWTVVLTDFSEGMLREARTSTSGLACRVHVAAVDAEAVPLGDHRVDVAIANHMLYHVPDRDRALQEVHRVLVPGGRFYAATIGKGHLRQLDEVVAECLPGAPSLHRITGRFSAENGLEQLRRWFPKVERETLDDELGVTDADAVAAYIRSITAGRGLDPTDLDRITGAVQREIDRSGAFVLDTRSALFVCEAPR